MQKRVITALFLLAFGFGLLAGPHPCSALQGGEPGRPPSASSCHGMEGEETGDGAHASAGRPSRDHDSDCCDAFCGHACQMTAVFESEPAAFAITSIAQVLVEAPGHGLPLFTHPIDHVPLA